MVIKQFQIHSYAICSLLEILLAFVEVHGQWVSMVMSSFFWSESMIEGKHTYSHTNTHTHTHTFPTRCKIEPFKGQLQSDHHEAYIVSWESEGRYCISKTFHWEPEGRYWLCTAIAPFWFSTEHLWAAITPFWLSTNDIHFHCSQGSNLKNNVFLSIVVWS